MALTGRLDELGVPEVMQLVALARKSGKLVVSDGPRRAVVVFRDGRIVFAASESLREAMQTALMETQPVSPARIREAVHDGMHSVGTMGTPRGAAPEPNRFEHLVRAQIEGVVRELVQWHSGEFSFDIVAVPGAHDITLNAGGYVLQSGLNPDEVLLKTLTKLDERDRTRWERDLRQAAGSGPHAVVHPESDVSGIFRTLIDPKTGEVSVAPRQVSGPPRDLANLRQLVEEVQETDGIAPSLTGDVALLVLRYAAQVVNRGVMFAVTAADFRPMGQFGIKPAGRPGGDALRTFRVPRGEASVLAGVAQGRRTFGGRLVVSPWNQRIVDALGGQQPRDVIVMPLVVEGEAVAVFYGDNLPDATLVGAVDGLEILMREIALAVEKARLQRRLQDLEKGRGNPGRS